MILAVGPRHSEYFATLFKKRVKDNKSRTSWLEMPDFAAAVFPAVLDYIYGEEELLSVHKKSDAFVVYNHAEYFEMPGLMLAVANWFRKRIELSKVTEFIDKANQFKCSKILLAVVVEKCAERFDEMEPKLAGLIGPALFLMVLERVWNLQQNVFHLATEHATALILECCQLNPSRDLFDQITDKRFMPDVHSSRSALRFLIIDAGTIGGTRQLSCLQKRCVHGLAGNFIQLCHEFGTAESMTDCLSLLPPHVMAEIMVRNSKFHW
jgi:hypothetical protein